MINIFLTHAFPHGAMHLEDLDKDD